MTRRAARSMRYCGTQTNAMDDLYLLIYPEMFPSLDPEMAGADIPLADCEAYDRHYGRAIERASAGCTRRIAILDWASVADIELDAFHGCDSDLVCDSPVSGWHYTAIIPARLESDLLMVLSAAGVMDLSGLVVVLAGTHREREIIRVRAVLEARGAHVRCDEDATLPPRRRPGHDDTLPAAPRRPGRRPRARRARAGGAPVITRIGSPDAEAPSAREPASAGAV